MEQNVPQKNRYYEEFLKTQDNYRWHDNRSKLVKTYAWAVPNDEAIKKLVELSPIVEVGAGGGYWAKMVSEAGGNIRAFDSSPPRWGKNEYVADRRSSWFPIERGQANVSSRFAHRTLFLCWPPYDTNMALEALRAYRGSTVVYVGEGWGGCTGNDAYHDQLARDFDMVDMIEIPRWFGISDRMTIWRRK